LVVGENRAGERANLQRLARENQRAFAHAKTRNHELPARNAGLVDQPGDSHRDVMRVGDRVSACRSSANAESVEVQGNTRSSDRHILNPWPDHQFNEFR
jgi:hypothetical protein